jgi:two-component system response regulator DevR
VSAGATGAEHQELRPGGKLGEDLGRIAPGQDALDRHVPDADRGPVDSGVEHGAEVPLEGHRLGPGQLVLVADQRRGPAVHSDQPSAEGGGVRPRPAEGRVRAGRAVHSDQIRCSTTPCCPGSGEDGVVTIRVFLLDDHELVRRGLRDLLETEDDLEVTGEASTADEALRRLPAARPDVAVLDVRLPDGSGVEVCRDIRSAHPQVHCLMLTSYADDEALFDAIMAGASGYVLKQVRGNELVEDIRRVAAGQSLLDPAVTARVLDRLRRGPEEDAQVAALTEQEQHILELLAEGLTNRQIAERMYLAEKTVKNSVSNLLAKMGMSRRTEAAVYAARAAERRRKS